MPGGIDPHTHLEMPSFGTLACDDFYRWVHDTTVASPHLMRTLPCIRGGLATPQADIIRPCRSIGACRCSGQAAALAGGTTMHIDFALPVNGSLSAGLREWRRKAAIAVMDYGFHMAVTSWDAQVSLSMLNVKACSYASVPLCLVACAVMFTSATPGMAQWCGARAQSIVPQVKVLEQSAGGEGHGGAGTCRHQQLQVLHGIQGRLPGATIAAMH